MDMLNPFQDDLGLHFPFWIWTVASPELGGGAYSLTEGRTTAGRGRVEIRRTGHKYYYSESALSDSGVDILAYVVTPSMTGEGIVGTDACLRRAYITMSSASGSMSVYGELKDGEDWVLQDTVDMSGGAARLGVDFALGVSPLGFTESNFSARLNMSLRSRRIKIRFEQDSGSFRFTLNKPVEFYFKAGGTRG